MYGKGLLKGMQITLGHLFGKAITEQYPERRPQLAPRFHGMLELDVEKCNACGTCANWCPNKGLEVETARDENKKRYLVSHKYNMKYCLFCNLCVEACPDDALRFNQDFEWAAYRPEDLLFDLKALGEKNRGKKREEAAAAACC